MTTITLEVPDDLAMQLSSLQGQLPKLLSMVVELFSAKPSTLIPVSPKTTHPVFREMLDFLVSGPTPEQIITFKLSPSVQIHLESLLDKNREGNLTDEEITELDIFEQVNYFLILLKAHARSVRLSLQ